MRLLEYIISLVPGCQWVFLGLTADSDPQANRPWWIKPRPVFSGILLTPPLFQPEPAGCFLCCLHIIVYGASSTWLYDPQSPFTEGVASSIDPCTSTCYYSSPPPAPGTQTCCVFTQQLHSNGRTHLELLTIC